MAVRFDWSNIGSANDNFDFDWGSGENSDSKQPVDWPVIPKAWIGTALGTSSARIGRYSKRFFRAIYALSDPGKEGCIEWTQF